MSDATRTLTQAITVVGIGEDGCLSLTSRAMDAIMTAEVLAGSARQLEFFPQFRGEKLVWFSPHSAYVDQIIQRAQQQDICVLASGDPLFYGIAHSLIARCGTAAVRVIPSVSSIQLACARVGWAWDQIHLDSVHGRPLAGLVSRLQQVDRAALLTGGAQHPAAVAAHLSAFGETHWRCTVCEALGSPQERLRTFSVTELAQLSAADFHTLALLLLERHAPKYDGLPLHCPDTDYQFRQPLNGLITKAPVRALAVAQLALRPDSICWDIGAGSGSIAIEMAKQAWKGQTYAVECNPDCQVMIQANVIRHKTDHVQLVAAEAPDGLAQLPAPDAVFIGGSRGHLADILAQTLAVLKPGGILVVSAVTLDTVSDVWQFHQTTGTPVEVLLVNVAQGQPMARHVRYAAENPIHLFIFKPVIQEDRA